MTVVSITAADIVSLGGSLPLSGFIDVWRLTPISGVMDKSKVGSQRVADGTLILESAPAGGAMLLVPRGVTGLIVPWAVVPPSTEISLVDLIAHHSVNPGTLEPTPDVQASWDLVLEQIRVISVTTAEDAATSTAEASTAATAATTATGAASAASGSASTAATAAGNAGTAATTATSAASAAATARTDAQTAAAAALAVGATTAAQVDAVLANPASDASVRQAATIAASEARANAATILRAAPRTPAEVYALSPESPTMTIGLAAAAITTSITGGRWRAPKRAAPGALTVDVTNDPAFRISGTPSIDYGSTIPNSRYTYPPLLTGGASQAARFTPTFRFGYDGRTLEMAGKCAVAGALSFRVKVDGKYVTPTAGAGIVFTGGGESLLTIQQNSAGSLAAGSGYLVKFDFGTAKQRVIEFEGPAYFGGIWAEPTATVTRGPAPRLVSALISDSIGAGAGTSLRTENWFHRASDLLGCDEAHNVGIGGTGYDVAIGTSNFLIRIADVVAMKPDIVFVLGGQNDQGTAATTFNAAVAAFNTALRAALPKALVVVMGMWTIGDASATRIQMNDMLRLNAAASGFLFVDMIDPSGEGRNAPAWAATTAYTLGDVVKNGTTPVTCILAHTSGSTYDATKWQSTSWIHGTGKEGSTTGLGNADLMIQSDGIHQTPFANDMMEGRVAAAVMRQLRTLADTPST